MIEVKDELWEESIEEEGPPYFKEWNQAYMFILGVHAIIIIIFYFIMRAYNVPV